jgi:hypothetical protein
MNRLRLNPATGRLAERLPSPADDQSGKTWFTWSLDGGELNVQLLSDEEVAGWADVVVAPRPADPEVAYAVACDDCDGSLATTEHERDRLIDTEHADHDTAPYAVCIRHPHHQDDTTVPTFAAGTTVTFHGSTTGQGVGLVPATIERPQRRDVDGLPVDGYTVTVGGRGMFVPATAVHLAGAASKQ